MSDAHTDTAISGSFPRILAAMVYVVAAGFGAVTLAGCEDPARGTADVVFPASQEEELGEKMEAQVACDPKFDLYEGEQVRDYIKSIGDKVVEAAGDETPEGIAYEFHVVDDDETINAFAMPGGEIYFYTGLLLEAETTSEVAGVMAHEVAHVTERHIAERLVAQVGLQVLIGAALGQNPGTIAELVAVLGANGALLTYGRKQEAEADDSGLQFLIDAGWDPQGLISFFETLQKQGGPQLPTILSSHPHPEDRIEALKKDLEGREFPDAKVEKERHQAIVKVIEDDSDQKDPSFSKPQNCDEILGDAGFPDARGDADGAADPADDAQ